MVRQAAAGTHRAENKLIQRRLILDFLLYDHFVQQFIITCCHRNGIDSATYKDVELRLGVAVADPHPQQVLKTDLIKQDLLKKNSIFNHETNLFLVRKI